MGAGLRQASTRAQDPNIPASTAPPGTDGETDRGTAISESPAGQWGRRAPNEGPKCQCPRGWEGLVTADAAVLLGGQGTGRHQQADPEAGRRRGSRSDSSEVFAWEALRSPMEAEARSGGAKAQRQTTYDRPRPGERTAARRVRTPGKGPRPLYRGDAVRPVCLHPERRPPPRSEGPAPPLQGRAMRRKGAWLPPPPSPPHISVRYKVLGNKTQRQH